MLDYYVSLGFVEVISQLNLLDNKTKLNMILGGGMGYSFRPTKIFQSGLPRTKYTTPGLSAQVIIILRGDWIFMAYPWSYSEICFVIDSCDL